MYKKIFNFKNFINQINKSKNIFLFGRSNSAKFFNFSQIKKNDISIGLNLEEINENYFNYVIFNKLKSVKKNNSFIHYDKIKSFLDIKDKFIIGNRDFILAGILFFLNQKLIKKKNIFLVGFDFKYFNNTYDIKNEKRGKNHLQNLINIQSQKDIIQLIKPSLKKINLNFVGYDFSSFETKISNKSNIKVVAEISTNHLGSMERCKKLIILAKEAGADFVKLQSRNVETFYSKEKLNETYKSPYGKTFRDYRLGLEFNDREVSEIIRFCRKQNIKIFFSLLDKKSFIRFKKFNLDMFKIPSTISDHSNYLQYVSKNYKDKLVISTGMTNANFLKKIIKLFNKNKKIYVLHCISSYPARYDFLNLKTISYYAKLLQNRTNFIPGYSSHDMGSEGSIFSIFCGAKMIEKHIKLGETEWNHYDFTAIDADMELKSFIKSIRSAEAVLGEIRKKPFSSEHHKYKVQSN
jgi:sialic acid synthase SpsE